MKLYDPPIITTDLYQLGFKIRPKMVLMWHDDDNADMYVEESVWCPHQPISSSLNKFKNLSKSNYLFFSIWTFFIDRFCTMSASFSLKFSLKLMRERNMCPFFKFVLTILQRLIGLTFIFTSSERDTMSFGLRSLYSKETYRLKVRLSTRERDSRKW